MNGRSGSESVVNGNLPLFYAISQEVSLS
jgi:hypothetical protein